jgi:hypothetical protein
MRFHARHTAVNRVGAIGVLVFLAALGLAACYTDYGLTYSDYDVVLTSYDKGTDFGAFKTFFMRDTVFTLGDSGSTITDEFDEMTLNTVASNFAARGYVRLTDTLAGSPPDFVVQVGKVTSTTIVAYSGGYWGGYYPWYGWGYGWGYYPYYPTTVSSYSQGSVLVTMIDPARTDTTAKFIGTVWFGGANGLIGDVTSSTQQRIYNSINQMFIQSPYLGSAR